MLSNILIFAYFNLAIGSEHLNPNKNKMKMQNLLDYEQINEEIPTPKLKLTQDLLYPKRYDPRVTPTTDESHPLKIHVTISLYQIIHVHEPEQSVKLNVWMIQRWTDELLGWNPNEYGLINTTTFPHYSVWIPDTYIYNSVVMNPEETERYMNIRADSLYWEGKSGSNMSFLYPAIYTISCKFNILYFPYDQQNCTIVLGSWTSDSASLDYYADEDVDLQSYIANEEWSVVSFKIYRHEYLYNCCPKPWVILEASLVIRRKPLFYIFNLIIPTSIITFVAILGFFTPASTGDERVEKFNLGITTLLAMSILLLMVADQMPTTSEFVPLIAWYFLAIMILIALGTFLTNIMIHVQNQHKYGHFPPPKIRCLFFSYIACLLYDSVPSELQLLWEELKDDPKKIYAKNFVAKKKIDKEVNHISSELLNGLITNPEVIAAKRKRQCCLEWAFLAEILDRICLIIFIILVIVVSFGLVFAGAIVHRSY